MDRKELESLITELVVKRLDALTDDVKRIDSNLNLIAEKLLSPIELRQMKRPKNPGGSAGGSDPYPQAAKGSS
ncbi:MAG TPA: hypothetical protein VF618_03655 [Thermoanaerobaculia bacterium]